MIRLALIASLLSAPVHAAQCAPRGDVITRLSEKYSESRVAGGLQNVRGRVVAMEIYASRETGTYTVLLTGPDGVSCIVAAGTNYFQVRPVAAGDPT